MPQAPTRLAPSLRIVANRPKFFRPEPRTPAHGRLQATSYFSFHQNSATVFELDIAFQYCRRGTYPVNLSVARRKRLLAALQRSDLLQQQSAHRNNGRVGRTQPLACAIDQ